MDRPEFYKFHQGNKTLPFSNNEYEGRLNKLRQNMSEQGLDACLFTSMHNIAYFSGFLYCAFGRSYGLVVTDSDLVTIGAGIDAAQPWRRSFGDALTYSDWRKDNFWLAISSIIGKRKTVGFESDHLTINQNNQVDKFLEPHLKVDIAPLVMRQRMLKSNEEISLIRAGAAVADIGGYAIRDTISEGKREIDIAMAGRDAMEFEIAKRFPDAEYRDTWVWFQSGINTDGAHNPVTGRVLVSGDILSLNAFPMISGYYTALERTMFLCEPSAESLKIWEKNIATHELGIKLLRPGVSCADVTQRLNLFLEEDDLLRFRTFGYGHSFGILSHYYGREAGLELREDIDTVLEPGMVVSMEPMLTIPQGEAGAGGYREHDILIITEEGCENITGYPYGPESNIIR